MQGSKLSLTVSEVIALHKLLFPQFPADSRASHVSRETVVALHFKIDLYLCMEAFRGNPTADQIDAAFHATPSDLGEAE